MKMKWAFYSSLNDSAKEAFDRGNGKYGRYIVQDKYLSVSDDHGVVISRMLIVRGNGSVIEERT